MILILFPETTKSKKNDLLYKKSMQFTNKAQRYGGGLDPQ